MTNYLYIQYLALSNSRESFHVKYVHVSNLSSLPYRDSVRTTQIIRHLQRRSTTIYPASCESLASSYGVEPEAKRAKGSILGYHCAIIMYPSLS